MCIYIENGLFPHFLDIMYMVYTVVEKKYVILYTM
jgi:hypothetical protein